MISAYIVWFAIFSFAGWLFECVYGALTTRHWENRGFLFGPLCPIYGVGAVAALVACSLPGVDVAAMPLWLVFLACMAGSAVLEYTVSYVFEKLFGAVWWDYSNLPLNVNGRICLPASLLFGIAGVLIVQFLVPFTASVDAAAPPLAMEVAALVIVAMVSVDATLTVAALSDLMDRVNRMEEVVNERMEALVTAASETGQALPRLFPNRESMNAEYLKLAASDLTSSQRALLMKIKRVTSDKTGQALDRLREARAIMDLAVRKKGGR